MVPATGGTAKVFIAAGPATLLSMVSTVPTTCRLDLHAFVLKGNIQRNKNKGVNMVVFLT